MQNEKSSWQSRLWRILKGLFWVVIALFIVGQLRQMSRLEAESTAALERLQQERKSRVIAMIHRQDTVSFFGVPVTSYINIEDSGAILRAIRLTPEEQPIDLILHTPGGLVLAAEQIAHALAGHKGKVTVFVPHYAMSGGTLIALTADEIVMDPHAVLGQVDPQLGDMPAASIVKLLEVKKPEQISDEMLVMIDMAVKARVQVASFVSEVLMKHYPKDKAQKLAVALSEGRFNHDYPITVETAIELGLPVKTEMPRVIYDLMDLYPQAGTGRPSVIYLPGRRERGMPPTHPSSSPSSPAPKHGSVAASR
jgi:ClpP class serine protease